MKQYRFIVPEACDGQSLRALARRMLPGLPSYALREAFARRDVKQDGARVRADACARGGAEVLLYAPEAREAPDIQTVFEDENVLVVFKPVGVSCEPDRKGGLTLLERLEAQRGDDRRLWLCHRLDNQTDGLLLLAKSEAVRDALFEAFRSRCVHKEYVCLVRGTPEPREATLDAYWCKDAQAARVRVFAEKKPGALPIRTGYRVVEAGEVARLRVRLYTGRTHQIRAQLAAIGHPILGDDSYGDRAFNRAQKARRMMLCSVGLSFSLTGELAYLNDVSLTAEPKF